MHPHPAGLVSCGSSLWVSHSRDIVCGGGKERGQQIPFTGSSDELECESPSRMSCMGCDGDSSSFMPQNPPSQIAAMNALSHGLSPELVSGVVRLFREGTEADSGRMTSLPLNLFSRYQRPSLPGNTRLQPSQTNV